MDDAEYGGWLKGNMERVRETPYPISGGMISPECGQFLPRSTTPQILTKKIQRQLSSNDLIQHLQLRC
jgi:hypothetical protein